MYNVLIKINYCETITETEIIRFANRYFKLVFSRKHILRCKFINGYTIESMFKINIYI